MAECNRDVNTRAQHSSAVTVSYVALVMSATRCHDSGANFRVQSYRSKSKTDHRFFSACIVT